MKNMTTHEKRLANEMTIPHVPPPFPFEAYAHVIKPLTEEDGGGYLITFPYLPGCMSDGENIEDALINGRDAFSVWMSARAHQGKPIPCGTNNPFSLLRRHSIESRSIEAMDDGIADAVNMRNERSRK
ncbi:MAG: type II toxin-antitoxin system HicB family antitoxin [Sulfurisoma sp.]|nr:type II toxin-antitoxin system HicB family antitoxin [Sulfurisoma sp.]